MQSSPAPQLPNRTGKHVLTFLLAFMLLITALPIQSIRAQSANESQYAKAGDQLRITNGNGYNVRSSAAVDENIVYSIGTGNIVDVLERVTGASVTGYSDQWYRIRNSRGQNGYLIVDFNGQVVIRQDAPVTPTPTTPPTPTPTPAEDIIASIGDTVEVRSTNGFNVRAYAEATAARLGGISRGYKFTVTNVVEGSAHFGGSRWYQFSYQGKTAYVMAVADADYQLVTKAVGPTPTPVPVGPSPTPVPPEPTPVIDPNDPEVPPGSAAYTEAEWQELLTQFPASYRESLNTMHEQHPSWHFQPYYHDFTLEYAVDVEMRVPARNLVPNWSAYRNQTYTRMYDAGGWYSINRAGLLFTMDPRNWLNEKYVFMFEKLSEVDIDRSSAERRLRSLFGSNQDLLNMIPDIISASEAHNVSPIFVGTRIKTEVVTGNTIANSAKGELVIPQSRLELLGIDADPNARYYNVFNIGAYQGSSPRSNGILFAMGFDNGYPTSQRRMQELMLPWTSPYRAIYGGIAFIKNDYIGVGQNSNYYMKYNLKFSESELPNKVWHQYMGNAFAPATEGSQQYIANYRAGTMEESFTFEIPVFENMTSSNYPNPGTQYPDSVKSQQPIDGDTPEIEGPILYAEQGDIFKIVTGRAFNVRSAATENSNVLTTVREGQEVTVLGRVTGDRADGFTDQWYRISFGSIVGYMIADPTGQTVINQSANPPTPTPVPSADEMKGDVSGDERISVLDVTMIKYHILGLRSLADDSLSAADVSGDGRISVLDVTMIKYHILGLKLLE